MEMYASGDFENLISGVVQDGLYLNNSFRILELPVDCSEQEINKRQKMIEIASKKNLEIPAGAGRVLPIKDIRDLYSYSDAAQRLLDPEKRFIDEYFWFWPEKFGDGASDESLQALKSGEIDTAIDIWTNIGSHVSAHNLAIYSHFMALENEHFHLLGETNSPARVKKMATYWSQAYKRWGKLIHDDKHWEHVKVRIRELADPRLTSHSADQMRDALPYLLLLINAKFVVQSVEKKLDSETVNRHVQIIRTSEFEAIHHEKAIRRSLEAIQQRAKIFISQAQSQTNSDPVHANKTALDLIKNTKSLLEVVQNLLPNDSPVSQAFHDDLVSCVVDCVVAYARKTENWGEGYKILKKAANLARSNSMRERVDTNLSTLAENEKSGSDWCANGYFDAPKGILDRLELAREKFRVSEIEQALQILEDLLSTVDANYRYLVTKPLAYCLNIKSVRTYQAGLEKFQARRKVLDKIALRTSLPDFAQTATAISTGQQQNYARAGRLYCMACGASASSQWAQFTSDNLHYLICMSCNAQDELERSSRKSEFATAVRLALSELTRAKEIDPSNPNVPGNISGISNVARELDLFSSSSKPSSSASPTPKPTPFFFGKPATVISHFISSAIDGALLLFVTNWLFGGIESIFIPLLLYYLLFQAVFHCTIGEAITKTRVIVAKTNSVMDGGLAFWRAIVYCGMVFALFYFWWGSGLFLMPLFNKDRRGLQDFLSGTMLINT